MKSSQQLGRVLALTRRNLLIYRRSESTLVPVVVIPAVFYLGSVMLFGSLMETGGIDYPTFVAPSIVIQAMIIAAIGSSLAVISDRGSGILDRSMSLPMRASTYALARAFADGARAIVSICVVWGCGLLVGALLPGSLLKIAGYLALSVGFAVVVSLGATSLVFSAPSRPAAAARLMPLYLIGFFLSTAFAPATFFPDWLRAGIRHQPVSALIEALRSLSSGQVDQSVVVEAVLWLILLGGCFVCFAGRSYRSIRSTPVSANVP